MRYSGTDERVEAVAGPEARRIAYDERQRTIGEYGTSAADVKAEHIWLMPDNDNGDGYEPLALAGCRACDALPGVKGAALPSNLCVPSARPVGG